MHYSQSEKILQEIKKAQRIIINIHEDADLDAIGSAIATSLVLRKIKKNTIIVSPKKIDPNNLFLRNTNKIQIIDFSKFAFSKKDFLLIQDTGADYRVTGNRNTALPPIQTGLIDHHKVNTIDCRLSLIDINANATCEILYFIFSDWRISIDGEIATALLAGILGDTVFFKYFSNAKRFFKIVSELVNRGADMKLLIDKMIHNLDFSFIKLIGEFINNMQYDEKGKFIWSAVPYESYLKYGKPKGVRETVSESFFRNEKQARFGVAILEQEKNHAFTSFRSKKIDISVLAKKLGGGGHAQAAACDLFGDFSTTVKRIISTASSFSKSTH